MKKILFVIEDLGGGGAERVLVNLVNFMDKSKYAVTVLTLFDKGVNAAGLSDEIEFVDLGRKKFRGIKTVYKFLPKKLLYRYYIKKYTSDADLVVSYMTGVPAFVVSGYPGKKILWVHGEYRNSGSFHDKFNIFGLRHIFNSYDAVVGVSDYVSRTVDKIIGTKKKTVTVYNTNDFGRIIGLASEPCEDAARNNSKPLITTVGCLEDTKGYDRLINVSRMLKNENIDFELWIMGEGIRRAQLEKMISDYSLENEVKLLGYCKNPFGYEAVSDLFVCSSRTEGLSTAVTEAIILGLPVVSTDVSGAREILGENNEYGLVVENSEDGIYKGIKEMLSDPDKLEYYRVKAKERSSFFATENTVAQAQKLFDEIMN